MAPEPDGWVSSFPPPPAPAKPMLPRETARRLLVIRLDGTREYAPRPTRAELLRHAEKYGVEMVADTAAEHMDVEPLASLIAQLDKIEDTRGKKDTRYYTKPRRKPAEVRAMALLGIEPEAEA